MRSLLIKRALLACAGLLIALNLTGCSGKPFDPATAYKGQSAEQLYKNGLKNLKSSYFKDATQYYQTLDARYPYSNYTERAQLDIIYVYYMNDDDGSALAASERFIHLHPAAKNVDYAYYMRALTSYESNIGSLERHLPIDFATRDLTAAKKAFLEYSELVNRFPNSIYVPDAIKRMVYLRNLLALHQLEVARYYCTIKAYVACVNRANNIVQHYQGAPVMPKALALSYQAYKHLGLHDMAAKVAKVYHFNYPKAAPLK